MKGSVMITSTGADLAYAAPTANACITSSSASSGRISSDRGRDEWIVIVLSANVDPFCNQSQLRRGQETRVINLRVMIRAVEQPQKIRIRVDGAAGRDRWRQDRRRRNPHDIAREQQLSIRGAHAGGIVRPRSPQIHVAPHQFD